MRQFLLLSLLFFTLVIHAQPAAKTVPGVLQYHVDDDVYFRQATASGNSIALRSQSLFALLDVRKGTVTRLDKQMNMISSDHRYTFVNGSYRARNPSWGPAPMATEIRSAGISSDTALRILRLDYYAVDIDEKGQLVATRIWYDSVNYGVRGMKGLYKLDRTTGKILQTLRDDTLFVCTERAGWNCRTPVIHLQKHFAVIKTFNTEPVAILPFGETKKIPLSSTSHTVLADSLAVFTISDSTMAWRKAQAFDTRTGALISSKLFDRPEKGRQVFEVYGNKLYQLRDDLGKISEETPGRDGFTQTKTWDLSTSMRLTTDQRWGFVVLKGPSFFVVPLHYDKGEAIGGGANTAFFLDGPSNKPGLQVYPFFNRTQQEVATAKTAKAKDDAWYAKQAAEKDSIAHPERYCYKFWNTEKYRRGMTIFRGAAFHIMSDYDCKADKYILWRPAQLYEGKGHYMAAESVQVPGSQFREKNYYTNKHYETCTACEGDGRYEYTEYTTKTKDLPWGYFSGIETKRISTKATTTVKICAQCGGNGVVLK